MRHQQKIYVQNDNDAVRNTAILNVNMSSDLCVFETPIFNLSGGSKIDCIPSTECCSGTSVPPIIYCDAGFDLTPNEDSCIKISITSVTESPTIYSCNAGADNNNYCKFGANFYSNIDDLVWPIVDNVSSGPLIDSSGTTVPILENVRNVLWGDVVTPTTYGRLNNAGLWNLSIPDNEWVGFTHCLEIETGGVYSMGICADDFVRIKVNGVEVLNIDQWMLNFNYWHVFPMTFTSGKNIIELEGSNNGSVAAFAAEIYSAPPEILSGLSTTIELDPYIVFSTINKMGDDFDLGENSGFSCPSGYSLDSCGSEFICSKIDKETPHSTPSCDTSCSGTTYIISTATTIPLTFNFTDNTESFTANSATFKFEIYKYNTGAGEFFIPPVYVSDIIQYSAFSASNSTLQEIPVSNLDMDGEYLVKGYYNFPICTEFMGLLGNTIDTLSYMSGTEYGIYDSNLDYFFRAIMTADTPTFINNNSNTPPVNRLYQQTILPDIGTTVFTVTSTVAGDFIVTLNGLTLSKGLDYTAVGNVVTLSSTTVYDDIITITYTTGVGNSIVSTILDVLSAIPSGTTNNEEDNQYYFNTDTGKYEVYTDVTPANGNSILITINGVTLADGIDYYQSISNPKRIILEGDILVGDVINIIYIPIINVVGALITNTPTVTWNINNTPELVNGFFSLEVSTEETFSTLFSSGITDYIVGQNHYSDQFSVTGKVGTTLYYRVKNEKNFVTLCDDIVSSTAYSETIPIIIQTNSINSY